MPFRLGDDDSVQLFCTEDGDGGVTICCEDWSILTITKDGNLVRHKECETVSMQLDKKGRIVEVDEDE